MHTYSDFWSSWRGEHRLIYRGGGQPSGPQQKPDSSPENKGQKGRKGKEGKEKQKAPETGRKTEHTRLFHMQQAEERLQAEGGMAEGAEKRDIEARMKRMRVLSSYISEFSAIEQNVNQIILGLPQETKNDAHIKLNIERWQKGVDSRKRNQKSFFEKLEGKSIAELDALLSKFSDALAPVSQWQRYFEFMEAKDNSLEVAVPRQLAALYGLKPSALRFYPNHCEVEAGGVYAIIKNAGDGTIGSAYFMPGFGPGEESVARYLAAKQYQGWAYQPYALARLIGVLMGKEPQIVEPYLTGRTTPRRRTKQRYEEIPPGRKEQAKPKLPEIVVPGEKYALTIDFGNRKPGRVEIGKIETDQHTKLHFSALTNVDSVEQDGFALHKLPGMPRGFRLSFLETGKYIVTIVDKWGRPLKDSKGKNFVTRVITVEHTAGADF